MSDDPQTEDCAWCGGEIDTPRPFRSIRGEVFCSRSHRDASARAVRRLHERDAIERRDHRQTRVVR